MKTWFLSVFELLFLLFLVSPLGEQGPRTSGQLKLSDESKKDPGALSKRLKFPLNIRTDKYFQGFFKLIKKASRTQRNPFQTLLGPVVQSKIELTQGQREFIFQLCNFLVRCSVYIVCLSVLRCSNLKLHQTLEVKKIFKQEKVMLSVK